VLKPGVILPFLKNF
jgi:Leucine-rich repeat (LRR) protein